MKFFAGLRRRIDVDDNIREVANVMHRFVPHFLGKGVPFLDGKLREQPPHSFRNTAWCPNQRARTSVTFSTPRT